MKRLGIAFSEYVKWLKNDKQIIFLFTLICLYMFSISPMKEYIAMFGEPVNALEPYVTFITNVFCVPVITLTFAVLMIDFPDISANATFVLIRTGRARWYRSQVGFVIMAAATMLAILFVFGIIAIQPQGFVGNVWSNSAKLVNAQTMETNFFRSTNPLSYLDLSVMTNFSVVGAVAVCSLLTVLHLTFCAQLQMTLALRFNRIIGLAANLLTLGAGMALQIIGLKICWLLPFAHSTAGKHYDELFNEVILPVWGSVLYLVAANILMYFLGVRVIKRKNLSLMSKED